MSCLEEIELMFVPNTDFNNNVADIEFLYKTKIEPNAKIAYFISNLSTDSVFYNSTKMLRQLPFDSIRNFKKEFGVDLVNKNLIPLFDIADAQFIVYDILQDKWCILHLDDNLPYVSYKSLIDLLSINNFF